MPGGGATPPRHRSAVSADGPTPLSGVGGGSRHRSAVSEGGPTPLSGVGGVVRHRSAVSGMGRDTDQRCRRVARHRSAVSDEWSDTAQRCRRRGPTPLSGVGGGVRHRSPSWVVPNLCIAFHDCFIVGCASLRRVPHDDGLRVALLDKITPQPRVLLTSFIVKQGYISRILGDGQEPDVRVRYMCGICASA